MKRGFIYLSMACIVGGAMAMLPVRSADAPPGVYVAVGYGGRRMSSTDGVTWTHLEEWAPKGGDDSNNLISAAYGKGKFVVVGGGGWTRETQAGHVLVSKNGAEWREAKKLPNRVSPIMFGGGRFVAGGPDKQLFWSEDGETWTPGAKIDYPGWAFWFRQGAYGNGRFVLTGNSSPNQKEHWCAVSKDGATVESFKTDLPPVRAIAFGAGRFVLVGPEGLRMSSRDGLAWEHRENAPGDALDAVVWSGTQFLASGGGKGYTSPDGITWTRLEQRIPCTPLWADARGYIGTSWPGQMWSSPDGLTWKRGEPLPPNGINQVAFGPAAR